MTTISVESSLLRHMRRQQALSRVELARQLSLAPSTVGLHVDRLISEGYLRESTPAPTSAGRPAALLKLNPEAGQFVGIDLDARQMYACSVDFAQRILRDRIITLKSNQNANSIQQLLLDKIEDVRDQHRPLLGIGLAIPGVIDAKTGQAVHYRYIRGWKNLPLKETISQAFHVPVQIENNVKTMALAEHWFGQAKDVQHALCLGIRTGVGCGILINGELYQGAAGYAGELGQWPCQIATHGPASLKTAQKVTRLEDLVSVRAILQQLSRRIQQGQQTCLPVSGKSISMESFYQAVESNDPLTCTLLNQSAAIWGEVLAQITMVTNPEKIVICGPLAQLKSHFLEPLVKYLNNYLPRNYAQSPPVVGSELGHLVGAIGAAALAVNYWQPTETSPSIS